MRDLESQKDARGGAEDKKELTPNQVREGEPHKQPSWTGGESRKKPHNTAASCTDGKEKSLGQGSYSNHAAEYGVML